MGWLFTYGGTKRELVAEYTKGWDMTMPDGLVIKTVCLRHCYKAVLWTVWERTFEKDGSQTKAPERWIGCGSMRYQKGYGWGLKGMKEATHPRAYSCPLGYLALVPVVACEAWREGVRKYHAKSRARRLARNDMRRA